MILYVYRRYIRTTAFVTAPNVFCTHSTAQTHKKKHIQNKAFKSGGRSWHLEIVFVFSFSPPIEANFYVGAVKVEVWNRKCMFPEAANAATSSGDTQKGSGRSSAPKASKSNQWSSLVFESADNAVYFMFPHFFDRMPSAFTPIRSPYLLASALSSSLMSSQPAVGVSSLQ